MNCSDDFSSGTRYNGYRSALAAAGIAEDPAIVRHGLRLPEDAAHALAAMLATPARRPRY
jgi:DNA-binding LacI/PurR family transcriptional regulator